MRPIFALLAVVVALAVACVPDPHDSELVADDPTVDVTTAEPAREERAPTTHSMVPNVMVASNASGLNVSAVGDGHCPLAVPFQRRRGLHDAWKGWCVADSLVGYRRAGKHPYFARLRAGYDHLLGSRRSRKPMDR